VHALTLSLLAATCLLYGAGIVALWRRAGLARGIRTGCVLSFFCGCGVLAAALLSPLHHAAERLLWAHMVQHELLMARAAPLIVLGRPLEALVWALPARWRPAVRLPSFLSSVVFAWALHAAAVWLWHLPIAFHAAMLREALHMLQHASFLATALLFWWVVLKPGLAKLAALAALFTTMLHTGALGALMALSPASWYTGYELADQQLAGLVMWVPGGIAYLVAALALSGRWLAMVPTAHSSLRTTTAKG
jgi:putative membrane protein